MNVANLGFESVKGSEQSLRQKFKTCLRKLARFHLRLHWFLWFDVAHCHRCPGLPERWFDVVDERQGMEQTIGQVIFLLGLVKKLNELLVLVGGLQVLFHGFHGQFLAFVVVPVCDVSLRPPFSGRSVTQFVFGIDAVHTPVIACCIHFNVMLNSDRPRVL
ncbi:hypothetical protein MT325_m117R [Paramecium bursaria chlorella virus MT325]|uniref:Uncharacterized protein m117R n=1 Tax=Paramecium bursaria Chlorella virus MT325 TaxID=346932 RepID=A7ITJ7_PBCVM|nr:hypothetical protein MT325_m117R [Paramecium bursaria chlorella virus MT325]